MLIQHMQKLTRFPQLGLMVLAGTLVLVCQLVAAALVAGAPPRSMGVRDLEHLTPQVALADCMLYTTSASPHGCMLQAQLGATDTHLAAASPLDDALASIWNAAISSEGLPRGEADMMRVAAAR